MHSLIFDSCPCNASIIYDHIDFNNTWILHVKLCRHMWHHELYIHAVYTHSITQSQCSTGQLQNIFIYYRYPGISRTFFSVYNLLYIYIDVYDIVCPKGLWLSLQVSFLGAGIFCAYLVFDTWRIAHELQVDDYIEGAVQLYMDIAPWIPPWFGWENYRNIQKNAGKSWEILELDLGLKGQITATHRKKNGRSSTNGGLQLL